MKFFLDANIPYSALQVFEELKLEATHARNIGMNRSTDKQIAEYAAKNRSILVTKDMEFANRALFPQETHHGLIILRLPPDFKAFQFANALKDFLKSINVKTLEKSAAIVKLGSYRIKKTE